MLAAGASVASESYHTSSCTWKIKQKGVPGCRDSNTEMRTRCSLLLHLHTSIINDQFKHQIYQYCCCIIARCLTWYTLTWFYTMIHILCACSWSDFINILFVVRVYYFCLCPPLLPAWSLSCLIVSVSLTDCVKLNHLLFAAFPRNLSLALHSSPRELRVHLNLRLCVQVSLRSAFGPWAFINDFLRWKWTSSQLLLWFWRLRTNMDFHECLFVSLPCFYQKKIQLKINLFWSRAATAGCLKWI